MKADFSHFTLVEHVPCLNTLDNVIFIEQFGNTYKMLNFK